MLKKQTLAELDFTISLVFDKIKIKQKNRDENKNQYQKDKESNRNELCENNYLFGALTKDTFLTGIDDVYQFYVDNYKNFIEIKYQTDIKSKQTTTNI